MFGYATDETDEAMPLSLLLAHKLMERLHTLRRNGILDWSLPDSKSQVFVLSLFFLNLFSFACVCGVVIDCWKSCKNRNVLAALISSFR